MMIPTAIAIEDGMYVFVNRKLTLSYEQRHGVRTVCAIQRKVSLQTSRTPLIPVPDDMKFEPETIATAREEIRQSLDNLEITNNVLPTQDK